MEQESLGARPRGFGWGWLVVGLLAAALFGAAVWFRLPPGNAVKLRDVEEIEAQLGMERFVSTNSIRFHSETMIFAIPVSKILGTSKDSVENTYIRDGARLGLNYEVKGRRAFNFMLPIDLSNAARARKIADDLAKLNRNVSVTIWTNGNR